MSGTIDLRAVNRAQFARAKTLWTWAFIAKLVVFAIGVAAAMGVGWSYFPQLTLLVAIVSECLQLYSDHVKSSAETVLRTLDLCRSFNRPISAADMRDIVMAAPRHLREPLRAKGAPYDTYFAKHDTPGPRQAIDNLCESAWFTKHQAFYMAALYTALIFCLLALSIATLMVVSREVSDTTNRVHAIKLITGWLMLIVSLGMLKNALAYYRMHQRCAKTENTCKYLAVNDVTESDAVKQWTEYQISRSSAPLLPDWLWQLTSAKLERGWNGRVA